jgi:hypothetical protein
MPDSLGNMELCRFKTHPISIELVLRVPGIFFLGIVRFPERIVDAL